jgi:putative DNA-invertase from lambdoid prophage Rac
VFAGSEREILRERVKAGIAQARKEDRPHGRPRTATNQQANIRAQYADGLSNAAIARRRRIGRASLRRLLVASVRGE